MNKKDIVFGTLLGLIITISACTKKEDKTPYLSAELALAEAVMYAYPDSALHILQRMQVPPPAQELEYATWALLTTHAKYKNFIKQSDSLVNIAYDYFLKNKDEEHTAVALYLKGGICNENDNDIQAQKYFLKAANYAVTTENYNLCYLIYSKLGNIYAYSSIKGYTSITLNKAYQYALKTNNPEYIISSLISLGRAYTVEEDAKNAISSYLRAIEIAKKNQNKTKIMYASNEIAYFYLKNQDYQNALFYAKQAQETDYEKKMQGQIFLMLGKIYYEMGKTDSAYHYLNELISFETYIRTLTDAYYLLYELSKKEQKYKNAIAYSDKLIAGLDSIHRLDKSRNLAEMQAKYDQQKIINEKNQLKLEKDKNTRNALIILALLLSIIAILIYIYQRKLMIKERALQKKEEEIRINTIKINENGILIKRNLLRMEELMKQIAANKDMQEQLEEFNKTYSEIQLQNEELTEENQMLQKNIDKYSSSLMAQSEELKKLNEIAEESQRLHNRERILCSQLVMKTQILHEIITAPHYIEDQDWRDIVESINMIFDNFTIRLSEKIPTLTEYDLHLCCLIKIGMDNTNIAILLGISPASVSKQKFRIKERIMRQSDAKWESSTLDPWIWDF